MSKIIVLIAMLTIVAAANATVTAGHYLWSTGTLLDGTPYESFRIFVEVTDTPGGGPDDWTAAGLDLDLAGGTFYQDPLGGNPPEPALYPMHPDLEYDTYYTSPGDYPNRDYVGGVVGIAGTADTDTVLDTDWFDRIDSGHGEFIIAQMTVLPTEPDWLGTGVLYYDDRGGSSLEEYHFTIPEPATLTLVLLGGLAWMRRRGA